MTPEAIQALFWLVRVALMTGPGAFLVAKGWLKPEQQADFATNAATALFGVLSAAGVALSWWARRPSKAIARVAALPEVHQVVTTPEVAAAQPSDKVVPAGELRATAMAAAHALAARPPGAVTATKSLMRDRDALLTRIAEEGKAFQTRLASPEAREAFAAFAERRKPDYSRF